MSSTYGGEMGNEWTVDEVEPGGVGSISNAGMVGDVSDPNSPTLLFRHIPESTMGIACDVPVT